MAEVLVDPEVSRAKFYREVDQYFDLLEDYHRRGIWLTATEYPTVIAVFGTPQIRPPVVAFAAILEFDNYDLWPPSLTIVDPFTLQPFTRGKLPVPFKRLVARKGLPEGFALLDPYDLMQAYSQDDIPFMCVPGVREYHANPGHTGDSWLLHRGRGEGTLGNLLEILHRYGSSEVSGFLIQQSVTLGFAGRAD